MPPPVVINGTALRTDRWFMEFLHALIRVENMIPLAAAKAAATRLSDTVRCSSLFHGISLCSPCAACSPSGGAPTGPTMRDHESRLLTRTHDKERMPRSLQRGSGNDDWRNKPRAHGTHVVLSGGSSLKLGRQRMT